MKDKKNDFKERIILGIDPGTQVMGYGLISITENKPSLEAMGVIELKKYKDQYLRLSKIYSRIVGLIETYLPDEMAIEAPFFGKNVQSMLKLGRAQGVAMAAALSKDVPITEYAPLKIKMSVTGNGRASKQQVAYMLQQTLKIPQKNMLPQLDATDGLAAALCHYYQTSGIRKEGSQYKNWEDFAKKNQGRIKK